MVRCPAICCHVLSGLSRPTVTPLCPDLARAALCGEDLTPPGLPSNGTPADSEHGTEAAIG
ncbi:hypothetical protein BDU57DRAFT_523949 [Ampelomyces quisqualis]|uniref:Uncharacterized protein n=1 Tax=Ampelomyces quisqualis TaxID=50730 RepID=A0A6A5Q8X2_AMPQU|nr:hypothetical protein BDU57DRAFT_523949 [Ampelomyces quisqualis]